MLLPFKISVLVFIKDSEGRHLLIHRKKAPNQGCWSPIGGKLEMACGESPFECAIRETAEETGHGITTKDLHLFGVVSERGYEGNGHWLMFLFDCKKVIAALPSGMDEGTFALWQRSEIETLALPPTDRVLVWPVYDKHREGLLIYRAECDPSRPVAMAIDEAFGPPQPQDAK
jgi:8-oxo-dGTP diphosphatase